MSIPPRSEEGGGPFGSSAGAGPSSHGWYATAPLGCIAMPGAFVPAANCSSSAAPRALTKFRVASRISMPEAPVAIADEPPEILFDEVANIVPSGAVAISVIGSFTGDAAKVAGLFADHNASAPAVFAWNATKMRSPDASDCSNGVAVIAATCG